MSKVLKTLSLVGMGLVAAGILVSGPAQAKKKTEKMAQEPTKLGAPLTPDDMAMMKDGAMRNMDKYMSSMDAMKMELPKAMMEKQQGSIAHGKELFNNTRLSTNGRACATCHPGGGTTGGTVTTSMNSEKTGKPYELPVPTLAGAAATFPKFKVPNDTVVTLSEMNNNCIMMFMMAKPLPLNSPESRDLAAYVTSHSNGETVETGKVPEMMKKMMGN